MQTFTITSKIGETNTGIIHQKWECFGIPALVEIGGISVGYDVRSDLTDYQKRRDDDFGFK